MTARSLVGDYSESLRDPGFWMYSTWLEVVTKYRRSRLGMFWALVPSAIYTFGIGGFFAYLQGMSPASFFAHMGLGYVLFRFITISLSEATTACTSHISFILDGRTRLTDYVLRVIGKAALYMLLAVPVVTVALYISPDFEWRGLITLIPSLLVLLLNLAWMGAIVAVIGARFPDVHELIGSVLMFSFLFTPIIWYAEQTPLGTLRGVIARLNPLFHLIELVRAPLLGKALEDVTMVYIPVMLLVGWALAVWVYRKYARFVPVWA